MTDLPTALPPHPPLSGYYKDEADRRLRVDHWFDTSAVHYNWINSFMSFGSGRWYRADVLKRLGVSSGQSLLDVGCGTGVLARAAQELVGPTGRVAALDPSSGMLEQARLAGVKELHQGHAEHLPFDDASFDWLTMGYALRHVTDLAATFAEYRRVLKPGGRILLLEISRPEGAVSRALLKGYMKFLVPGVTRLFRRSPDAAELMRYYWDTIEQCVPPAAIVTALANAGLVKVERHASFGMLSEYVATRPV